ncbi:MAG: hypothetical protein EPN26_10015 [Rhodospirillales bacterium]|nr:MAG: hypothetical protein EPN26_10015 [Rhodospirillales bacterium]
MSFEISRQLYDHGLDLLKQGRTELALARFLDSHLAAPANAAPALRAIDLTIELDRPKDAIALSRDLFSRYRDDGMETILSCPLPAIPACADDVDLALDFFAERMAELTDRPGFRLDHPHLCLPRGQFLLPYHDRPVRRWREAQAAMLQKAHPELGFAASHAQKGFIANPSPKLGVVSGLLAKHTVGMITVPLLQGLIKQGIGLHLFLTNDQEDGPLAALKREAASVTHLPYDLAKARDEIAKAKLDVLLYPEIGMEPFVYALAFARMAPLQLMMWGHPMTSGLASIDGFISSHLIEPEGADAHYTETLLRLPVMPVCVTDHYLQNPPARSDLGLPEDMRLYVCPQSLFKLSPAFDAALAGILKGDPRGEIVLIGGQKPDWECRLKARLSHRLGENLNRVRILPRLERIPFIGLLATADVLLDPFGFSGGNTSAEALANGTPIVTLPGKTMAGRVTLGFLKTLEIEDTVAKDEADYIRQALSIAQNSANIRARIMKAKTRLFGSQEAARHMAEFIFRQPDGLKRPGK